MMGSRVRARRGLALAVLLAAAACQAAAGAARADVLSFRWSFDLVATNTTDVLAEPPGDLLIEFELDTGAVASTPYDWQLLRDAATPALTAAAASIKDVTEDTNRTLLAVRSAAGFKDSNALQDLPRQAVNAVQTLNSFYATICQTAAMDAEYAVKKRWKEIQESRREYSAWQLKARVGVAKGVFAVIWGTTKVVLDCTLSVPTAGASGVFLAYDLYTTVSACADLAGAIRTQMATIDSAGKSLRALLADVNKNPSMNFTRVKLAEIEKRVLLLRMKMLGVREQIRRYAALLDESCLKEDALRAIGGTAATPALLADLAARRNQSLRSVDALNAKLDASAAGLKQAADLVQTLSLVDEKGLAAVRDRYWPALKDAFDKAMTVWGFVSIDGPASAAVAAIDAALLLSTELPPALRDLAQRVGARK
ncbi:MAG: hypothetical protein U0835_00950 [Isosphaeraceae bacterium]